MAVPDRFAPKYAELERRLLEGGGTLAPDLRRRAAEGGELPEPLAGFVDKVRRHAYRVTDQDVEALRAAGYSEDQIFEATVSAAFGAARLRLRAGREAAAGASEAAEGSAP